MRWRSLLSLSAWCLSGSCLLLALCTPLLMSTTAQPRPAAELPADLAAVPKDAIAFVHVRVAELWNSPTFRYVQRQVDPKMLEDLHKGLTKTTGLSVKEVDRLTFVLTVAEGMRRPEPCFLVQTLAPVNKEQVLQALVPGAQADAATGIHARPDRPYLAVKFMNDRLLAIGSTDALRVTAGKGEGTLAGALKEAAGQHHLFAGFQVSKEMSTHLRDLLTREGPHEVRSLVQNSLGWLFDLQHGTLAMQFGYSTTCKVELGFGGEWQAKRAFRFVHGGVLLLQTICGLAQHELRESRHFVQLLSTAENALDDTTVEIQGTTVRASIQMKFPPAALDQAMLEAFQNIDLPLSPDRLIPSNYLRQLGIAMHNYHNDYDRLPGHAIYSKDGKPLLSWRVAILPYIEQDNLYKQFKLDEPWDSEHNKKLLPLMPKIFEMPQISAGQGLTYFQVPVTPADYRGVYQTIFKQAPRSQKTLGQITVQDGTSNTIMILEADKPVPWTKPEDHLLPPDDKPLPKFGADPATGKFLACFGDGSVRVIRNNISPELYQKLLRQMLGVNDGLNEDTSPLFEEEGRRRRPTRTSRPVEQLVVPTAKSSFQVPPQGMGVRATATFRSFGTVRR